MNASVVLGCHLHDFLLKLLLDSVRRAVCPFLKELVRLGRTRLAGQIVNGGQRTNGLLSQALDLSSHLDTIFQFRCVETSIFTKQMIGLKSGASLWFAGVEQNLPANGRRCIARVANLSD